VNEEDPERDRATQEEEEEEEEGKGGGGIWRRTEEEGEGYSSRRSERLRPRMAGTVRGGVTRGLG